MTYEQLAERALGQMGPWCKPCRVCDGRACGAHIPGPGAKGSGRVAMRNHEAWKDYRLALDTIHSPYTASVRTHLLNCDIALPVMIAPLGDVRRHYGDLYDTATYNQTVLSAAHEAGTLAWTGDGLDGTIMNKALMQIGEMGGWGIPTIKPWSMELVEKKLEAALAVHPVAIAMDVDAAGLPFLKGCQPPAGAKSRDDLRRIAHICHQHHTPFVVKGIMTVKGAQKAVRAHADAIVVSNHGGRVLDGVPATAEALPEIADAVRGQCEVLVDGGIRSGVDVFRALAMGAHGVLICRPFVVATFGGGAQGVKDYLAQLSYELADAMEMCGAQTIDRITIDMLW